MTAPDPLPPDDHPIDRAVRAHLGREAAKVDARAVLAQVKAAAATPASARRGWLRWAAGIATGAAVAAGVALAFILGSGPEPTPVAAETPAELIEQAREAHAAPTDRCYEVTAEWDPAPLRRQKLEPIARRSKLWTRGDQFFIETVAPDGRTVAWGQARDGHVWAAPSRKRGLLYDPSEVGEPLARHCELMSLRVVTTLGELLQQYDLSRKDSGRPGEPIRIEARLRPSPAHPRFRHVELELDPETKVIRSAALRREVNGETVGTLTFTLVETAELPDDRYDLRGHLDPDAVVLDGKPPPKLPGPPRPDPRAKFRDEFLKRMQGRLKG